MPITEERIRDIIREELARFSFSDRFVSPKTIQILDGRNIIVGKGKGTEIGTEAAQKISFHGVTSVIQASAISAPSSPGGVYSQAEAQSMETAVNAIRTALQNKGLTA